MHAATKPSVIPCSQMCVLYLSIVLLLIAFFFFFFIYTLFRQIWHRITMHSGDYRGGSRLFLQPQNGSNMRSPGYVPGRIVPLRPPPLPKTQASAKFNSAGQEAHATFGFSRDEQNNHAQVIRRRRHKNTLICFAISSLSFFIILAIVLGISSKYAPDGKFPYIKVWVIVVNFYI